MRLKINLSQYRGDLIAKCLVPNVAFIVPPEMALGFGDDVSSERHVKRMLKRVLLKAANEAEIIVDESVPIQDTRKDEFYK